MSASTFLTDSLLPRLAAVLAGATFALTLTAPTPAMAAACGDDVDGQRVPCACGDNVVSDTVLWATDPVVTEPCSGDGLVLFPPASSNGITLNLGGQSILGSGRGSGIRVVRGGKVGSTILGGDAEDARAEIARFDTGIRASGRSVLLEIRGLDVHANLDEGLKIRTSGVRIVDVRSDGNGGHGVALSGHGNQVVGVSTDGNAGDGLQVRGSGTQIDAETAGNGGNGASIGGRGNRVANMRSVGNGRAGLKATGLGHRLDALQAPGNAGGEIDNRVGAAQ